MKKLFLILTILFLSATAQAQMLQGIVAGESAASAGASCSLGDSQTDGASAMEVKDISARTYVGQGRWQNASSRCICKVAFYLTKATGSITGKTYKAHIFAYSGGDLGAELTNSPSAGVTGSDAWSGTEVEFTFDTCVTVGATTDVAILIAPDEAADASNYASMVYYSTATDFTGATVRFTGPGGGENPHTGDTKMKIYW